MAEPLFILDLLFAFGAAVGAIPLGRRAAHGRRLRWPLIITAVFVAARVVLAALLWAESWYLVSDRILLGLPVAVVPLAAAFGLLARGRAGEIAAQVAAVGVLISAYLAWVPQDPASRSLILALALCLLAATGAVAAGRTTRTPWLTGLTALALITAVTGLYVQNQAPATAAGHGIDIATLTGPREGTPDVRFTLVAAHGTVRLASGREIDALTFNGSSPGPTLRVRQGQLVEVTLVNTDIDEGVTVHWHGIDVPNAEDGVPGLTQDAVLPGGRHVYRFVPNRTGTFWYHTHRDSQEAVARGLFGAFLVDPPSGPILDGTTIFTHQWPVGEDLVPALDTADTEIRRTVQPGQPVLLRLINSSQDPQQIQVTGASYRVTAIDGNTVHEPGPLPDGGVMLLAAGGRYDLSLTMPATPVVVSLPTTAHILEPAGRNVAAPKPTGDGPVFDPARYGTPVPAPTSAPNRTFDLVMDNGFGFANGAFTWANTVNGASSPAIPSLTVSLGDTVWMRFTNRGITDHPMHLHGHRIRVLTRNGSPVTGSTWWTDTLNVAPGESYEITFTADNPGIWMDHCHNFEHATNGMLWHLAYTGITAHGHAMHDSE